jgi:hypothetical protein
MATATRQEPRFRVDPRRQAVPTEPDLEEILAAPAGNVTITSHSDGDDIDVTKPLTVKGTYNAAGNWFMMPVKIAYVDIAGNPFAVAANSFSYQSGNWTALFNANTLPTDWKFLLSARAMRQAQGGGAQFDYQDVYVHS